jgi:beta-mannosidase
MELNLSSEWSVLQDVHHLGEKRGIFKADFDPTAIGPQFSEWKPIERLDHLQLLFANTPYFGRELRHFNHAPWWYRYELPQTAMQDNTFAALRFEGVDYFCKVWLNEQLIGEHEGYSSPFEYEVGHLLQSDKPNVIIVKVWSPWDEKITENKENSRFWSVIRDMMKGTYEHDDTFVQRDVNPIGIWGPVKLRYHSGIHFDGKPAIQSELSENGDSVDINIVTSLLNSKDKMDVVIKCRIINEETGVEKAATEQPQAVESGKLTVEMKLFLQSPKLWNTWDRGESHLYKALIELWADGVCVQTLTERFGIRNIEVVRTQEETTYYLNGNKIYLRGVTYFPDVYVSSMYESRYRRDLEAIKRAGFNVIRIHVHTERQELYDLCDELGIAVFQDSDFNWTHPGSEEWKERAVRIFRDMIKELHNHPSIITWICMNEPDGNTDGIFMKNFPGPQLLEEAKKLDPTRPTIKGSWCNDDLESGDSHNYIGSLVGENTHYLEIYGTTEKLNTEYGFDAPASVENLRRIPEIYNRLKPLMDGGIESIQFYQYRLLKYYTEHYRITKYARCSGYFQFMFIDFCPQSFYGIYDWWGVPKKGLQALLESNQPLGIFMEYKDEPIAIWVVNDYLHSFTGSSIVWMVSNEGGSMVVQGEQKLDIISDSVQKVTDLSFSIEQECTYTVSLYVRNSEGQLLAKNIYKDAFHHPAHPKGHPHRMSHELGVRLYWA